MISVTGFILFTSNFIVYFTHDNPSFSFSEYFTLYSGCWKSQIESTPSTSLLSCMLFLLALFLFAHSNVLLMTLISSKNFRVFQIRHVRGKYNKSQTVTLSLRSEVFTAVTMKNGIFWDVTLCGSCKNWHFGGTSCHPDDGGAKFLRNVGSYKSHTV
jgi:hypothetical protein